MNAPAKEILTKTHKIPLRGKNIKSIAVYGSGEALSRYATKEIEEVTPENEFSRCPLSIPSTL